MRGSQKAPSLRELSPQVTEGVVFPTSYIFLLTIAINSLRLGFAEPPPSEREAFGYRALIFTRT